MCVTLKMSSHFNWYPSSEEIVVPWNARYAFPSQANKAIKITPRIPPKSGQTFAPGQIMRLEFPAQGYVNPINTTLEFDVTIVGPTFSAANNEYVVRFQNNIQSIFQRVRLLYGATPLEDILNYNVIVRCMTEWVSTNQINTMDDCSIADGIGHYIFGADQIGNLGLLNTRQTYIHGVQNVTPAAAANLTGGTQVNAVVPNGVNPLPGVVVPAGALTATRRYQVSFALGLFNQDKLIPVKFMASQLAIEITLETAQGSMFYTWFDTRFGTNDNQPTYYVGNVNLIPEILEFDASYDAMFLRGLREGGVPIKFSSWHSFFFSSAQSSSINLLIQERSRSVKAIFAVQRQAQANLSFDNGATLFDTSANGQSSLQTYQFRIGGRYFPAAPVQTSTTLGSAVSNGGAEAYLELQKALNCVGDYRLSPSVNTLRWALQNDAGLLNIYDGNLSFLGYLGLGQSDAVFTTSGANAFSGNLPSACFAMAIDLETSSGMEISGLNAEEQSDIALLANWTSPQVTGGFGQASSLEVYSYYDAMIVLRENNVLELIQ
jgi:hypothetical protein